jgi:hypothetical protein
MSEFPPFAIGPHYLISRECGLFVSNNMDYLTPVGTIPYVHTCMHAWTYKHIRAYNMHCCEWHSLCFDSIRV